MSVFEKLSWAYDLAALVEFPKSGYLPTVVNVASASSIHGHAAAALHRIVAAEVWPSLGDHKSAAAWATLRLDVRDQLTGRMSQFLIPGDTGGP